MRKHICLAATLGALAVILGAFGAHSLKETLAIRNGTTAWQTAVLYHLVHSATMLAASLYVTERWRSISAWLARACIFWGAGIALFSGSLYVLALGGPRWLGPVTPLGGLALIAGWICVFCGAIKTGGNDNSAAN